MTLFTSKRERRLWILTLVVVATIYSTLGLARTLAGELRDRNMLDNAFVIGFFLLIAAVVIQGLRKKPGGLEIGVWIGIGAVYLMAVVRMGLPEERTHLFEYSLVALLIYQALMERRSNGGRVRFPAAAAVVATALLGWIDEGIQALMPSRVYDIVDVGFNALAGLMAVLGILALGWARRLKREK